MGLKGALPSVMQAYKCWSLWSLLPAACWSGREEQLLQRPEDGALGATGKTLQERTGGVSTWIDCGGLPVTSWCNFKDEYLSKEAGV